MNWLLKNSYVSMFLMGTAILGFYFLLMNNDIETYEHIEIRHGDTLWMLADSYSGKMDKKEWIAIVKKVNYLHSDEILAGQQLLVPIVASSRFTSQRDGAVQVVSDYQ